MWYQLKNMGLKSHLFLLKICMELKNMYSVSICIISDYLADSKLVIFLAASLSR